MAVMIFEDMRKEEEEASKSPNSIKWANSF
jgi:hypothetical protein